MQNITTKVEGDTLVLSINLKNRGERSKSGKSILVASSNGIIQVAGVSLGVNVFVPAAKAAV